MKHTTLVLLMREGEILLAMKKRGFGMGKWNGAGGKIEPGETVLGAAVREVREELGVDVAEKDLERVGEFRFFFTAKPEWNIRNEVFLCRHWSGEIVETEEMRPQWFKVAEIPYHEMWADDQLWLPKVLAGEKVEGEFSFGPDNEQIIEYKLVQK